MNLVKHLCSLFYNSFLKKKLHERKYVNIKYMKRILSKLTCVLIYLLTKCVLEDDFKILQNLQKYIHDRVY